MVERAKASRDIAYRRGPKYTAQRNEKLLVPSLDRTRPCSFFRFVLVFFFFFLVRNSPDSRMFHRDRGMNNAYGQMALSKYTNGSRSLILLYAPRVFNYFSFHFFSSFRLHSFQCCVLWDVIFFSLPTTSSTTTTIEHRPAIIRIHNTASAASTSSRYHCHQTIDSGVGVSAESAHNNEKGRRRGLCVRETERDRERASV